MIQHVAPAPVAICGNGILEGDEVCDYGVLNNDENKYRCGPTVGISSVFFNDDGVGSPFSNVATACIRQCGSILPGNCFSRSVFPFFLGDNCYHWAEARAIDVGRGIDSGSPADNGAKTCTPE